MEVGGPHIGPRTVFLGRFAIVIAILLVVFDWACGPGMQKNLLSFQGLEQCPVILKDTLVIFDPNREKSDVQGLKCTLDAIRKIKHPRFEHAISASQICSLLAENAGLEPNGAVPRERLAWEGVQWAEYAVSSGGYSVGESHYYMAVNLGLAVENTVITALKSLGRLEKELQMALKMNPATDHGGPMRVLGYLYVQAPGWPQGIGDSDRGFELLESSASEFGDFPLNHIYLAKAMWDVDGDSSEDSIRNHILTSKAQIAEGDWGLREKAWEKLIRQIVEDSEISARVIH